jgi:hypothetical protein
MLKFIIKKLKERSNILIAITYLAGLGGLEIAPELANEISTAVVAIITGVAIYLDDKSTVKKKKK